MKTEKQLGEVFDLSNHEAKIFNTLNQYGPLNVSQISKKSGLARTALYPPINSLMRKGFVSVTEYGKRKYYDSVSLETLESIFSNKQTELTSLLTELSKNNKINSSKEQLDAQLFVGAQGIKSAGMIFMNETKEKEWYSFEDLSSVIEATSLEFENYYIKERVRKGIFSKMILSYKQESKILRYILENDQKQLRETVALSPNRYVFDSTFAATRGMLLLINPQNYPFALLIRNSSLASTFINIHRVIWDRYRK